MGSAVLQEVVESLTNLRLAPGTEPSLDLNALSDQHGHRLVWDLKQTEYALVLVECPADHAGLEQLSGPAGGGGVRRSPSNSDDVDFTNVILGDCFDYGQLP